MLDIPLNVADDVHDVLVTVAAAAFRVIVDSELNYAFCSLAVISRAAASSANSNECCNIYCTI